MKLRFSKPKCDGRECFVDNRYSIRETKAFKRALYPSERYCLYNKKARRFMKRDATFHVPGWCPRLYNGHMIRIYTRVPESFADYLYRRMSGENWEPLVDGRQYALRRTTSTSYTPAQFSKKLSSGICDCLDLLGYEPKKYDVVEIDNGLTSAYLHLNKDCDWVQIFSFDKTKCDDGSIGGYTVRPHENRQIDRFSHTTEEYEQSCIGYMRGYFAEGRFQGHWQDNRHGLAGPALWGKYEALLDALKMQGFLRGGDKMLDYCLRFPQGALPGGAQEYGYMVDADEHIFYIRCLPYGESYNIYLYVYRNAGEER